ncbi:hypothetical protein CDL15_Pgr010565 [Punica granatum]|uniref:Uncharacterized protein n=1 Tax=Punica granatum TaxID=22663 RepID=A0A218XFY3_PUNGR|nr:hypothetical protein CDL15_Pgr010565 [Punica granatum]
MLRKFAGMLTRASLLSCYAISPSQLTRASFDLAGSAHPCEFTFMLRKFAETAGTFFLRPCWVCSPMRVYFHASQVRGACSLVLLTTLPGLLTPASLRSYFASLPRLRARSSCDLARSAHPCEFTFTLRNSQSLLARASCNIAESALPCEFTFMLRKFAEPARPCEFTFMLRKFAETAGSFFLQPCRVCSPERVYFHASQVRGACSLVPLTTLPSLLTPASLLSYFASSPRLRARRSCDLAGSAHPREFTFRLRNSPSLLARASCNLADSAHPCEFTFLLRKLAETAWSCYLQPCWVCSPMRVYFHALQVRQDCWLVLFATLPGLLTCASLLSRFASTRSLLALASYNLAESAHPYEFTFILRKFAEIAGSFFLRPCRVSSPMRVYFHALQVRQDCWLVLFATLPGLLTCASLLSRFASTRSLLALASYNLAESAHPYEFTFILRKFAEIAGSFFLRPCLSAHPF